jgi:RHS repeat-associated protein
MTFTPTTPKPARRFTAWPATAYSPLDQLTKVQHGNADFADWDVATAAVQTRTFEYDAYGRAFSQTTPEAGTTYVDEYWANDLVKKARDARGVTRTLTYDRRGLLTDVDYSDQTPDVRYEYGEYGERKKMEEKHYQTQAVLGSTTYAYDQFKRLEGETRVFNGLSGTYSLSYAYNYAGGLTQMTYNVNGWVRRVNYEYYHTGALSGVGTNIRAGWPETVTNNVTSGMLYRNFGALKQANYGNGQQFWADYSADRLQLKQLVVRDAADPTDAFKQALNKSYDYTYDAATGGLTANDGRLKRVTDNLDAGFTVGYEYDDFNRLKKATAGAYARTYTYDAWANLTGSVNGIGGEVPNYTLSYAPVSATNAAPATNRPLGYGFDSAGNETAGEGWARVYDAANRITTANAVTMEYDGDGRRVKNDEAWAGNITYYYLWSSVLGEVVADLRPDFAEVYHIPFRAYIYKPSGGTPIAMQGYNTGFYYLYGNHLGSGHVLADEGGGVVQRSESDPHGQRVLGAGSVGEWFNQKKFTGYERDYAGGTYYAKARQYQPYRGRFMQADPLGLGASDLTNPQSLNRYSYVHNDPINFTDPLGLYEGCVHEAVTRYLARLAGIPADVAERLGALAGDKKGGADSFANAATNPWNLLRGLFGAGPSAKVHFANAVVLHQRASTLVSDIREGKLQRAAFTFHGIQDVLGAHAGFNSVAGHLQLNKKDLGKGVDRVIGDQKFENMVDYTFRLLTQSSQGNGLTAEQKEGLWDEIINECGRRKNPPPLLILPRMIAGVGRGNAMGLGWTSLDLLDIAHRNARRRDGVGILITK